MTDAFKKHSAVHALCRGAAVLVAQRPNLDHREETGEAFALRPERSLLTCTRSGVIAAVESSQRFGGDDVGRPADQSNQNDDCADRQQRPTDESASRKRNSKPQKNRSGGADARAGECGA